MLSFVEDRMICEFMPDLCMWCSGQVPCDARSHSYFTHWRGQIVVCRIGHCSSVPQQSQMVNRTEEKLDLGWQWRHCSNENINTLSPGLCISFAVDFVWMQPVREPMQDGKPAAAMLFQPPGSPHGTELGPKDSGRNSFVTAGGHCSV